jgi:chemotaxis protein histidine kinase CheA
MTFDLYLFAMAFGGVTVAILVAGWAFQIHKRDFWKIREWELMRRDAKTLDAIQEAITTKSEENRNINERLLSLADELAAAEKSQRDAAVAKAFLEQNKQRLADETDLNKRIAVINGEYCEASIKVDAANAQISELNKTITELQSKKEWLDKAELEKEIQELKKQKAELEQTVNDPIKGLKAKRNELERIQSDLETKIPQLQAIDEDLKSKQLELDKLNASIELDKQIGDLRSASIEILGDMDKTAKGTVEIRKAAFKDLYKPVFQKQTKLHNWKNESEALQNLEKHVRLKHFDFPQRLLYAFHTALKTSDISCLTVMAGVSGTGKSALPKLYSEAMGMHLCMLSVEPRWDSPRDLFGFFNYMENRYEPTLLARSLMQFDPYAIDEKKENNTLDLNGQMLLVLLDEMNLARIEYYFSEYLSKLELRRDLMDKILASDEESRHKVSMELFRGWKPKPSGEDGTIESAIHLYAHTNVLFTGTMNEDETTQSLSDKVIDRANVLHFGRPAELKADLADSNPGLPAPGYVSHVLWKDWSQSANQNLIGIYVPRLKKLNDLMAKINRPFAHRTSKAILAYIANYPNNQHQVAFADQIAMRIMPKLRGLDLESYRSELLAIQSFVESNDVGDAKLIDATGDAMANQHGFFRWQGIDWA